MQIKWDIDLQHLLIYNYYTCIVLRLSSNATSFVDDLYCFFQTFQDIDSMTVA